jgi:hypothetical protein
MAAAAHAFGQEDDISVMSIVGDLICFVLKKLDVAESPKHSSRGFRSIERALFLGCGRITT